MIDELLILDRFEGDAPSVTSSSPVSESPGAVQDPSPVPVATPSVSVSPLYLFLLSEPSKSVSP